MLVSALKNTRNCVQREKQRYSGTDELVFGETAKYESERTSDRKHLRCLIKTHQEIAQTRQEIVTYLLEIQRVQLCLPRCSYILHTSTQIECHKVDMDDETLALGSP